MPAGRSAHGVMPAGRSAHVMPAQAGIQADLFSVCQPALA